MPPAGCREYQLRHYPVPVSGPLNITHMRRRSMEKSEQFIHDVAWALYHYHEDHLSAEECCQKAMRALAEYQRIEISDEETKS